MSMSKKCVIDDLLFLDLDDIELGHLLFITTVLRDNEESDYLYRYFKLVLKYLA